MWIEGCDSGSGDDDEGDVAGSERALTVAAEAEAGQQRGTEEGGREAEEQSGLMDVGEAKETEAGSGVLQVHLFTYLFIYY